MELALDLTSNRETKKYNTINAYLTGDVYKKIREMAFDNSISMSCYAVKLVESFLSIIKDDINEYRRQSLRFKNRFQVYSTKIKEKRKIGVVLNDDSYNRLKNFSIDNNITMSEIIRVLINDDIDNGTVYSNMSNGYKHEQILPQEDKFEMYIDLG